MLIVGGGEVASQRIESILGADANIILLAPFSGLSRRTKDFLSKYPSRITHRDREYSGPSEINDMGMVLTALDDVDVSRDIVSQCRTAKIPVNAADIPPSCDFYFGSQIRDGPLQIMISTNGNGPRLAALVKGRVQAALSGKEGAAIEKVGQLRTLLKQRAPGVGGDLGRRRMKWMTKLCNEWDMDDFTQLDEAMMNKLLDDGWENDIVPPRQATGGPITAFFTGYKGIAIPGLTFLLGVGLSAAFFLSRRPSQVCERGAHNQSYYANVLLALV